MRVLSEGRARGSLWWEVVALLIGVGWLAVIGAVVVFGWIASLVWP